MGAKRAAKDQQQGLVLAHPQRSAAASAIALKHGAAHRVAGHNNLGMGAGMFTEDLLNAGLRNSDKRRGLGGLLVGKAGYGVLLVQRHGDTHLGGGAHKRELDVGAKADGHVRFERGIVLKRTDKPGLLAA